MQVFLMILLFLVLVYLLSFGASLIAAIFIVRGKLREHQDNGFY